MSDFQGIAIKSAQACAVFKKSITFFQLLSITRWVFLFRVWILKKRMNYTENTNYWKNNILIFFVTQKKKQIKPKWNMKNYLHIHPYWKIKLLCTYSKLMEWFLLWRTAEVVGTIKSISVWGKVHKPLKPGQ